MKSTGLVIAERAYVGGASPPDTFEDESRNGADGVHSAVTWVKLPSGLWVRSFNGSTSDILLTTSKAIDALSDKFGFSFWVLRDASQAAGHIISKDGYALNILCEPSGATGTNHMRFIVEGGYDDFVLRPLAVVTIGVWCHFFFTYDGTTAICYKNGASFDSNVDAGRDAVGTNQACRIGEYSAGAGNYGGDLVLFKTWNYPPSAELAAAIFQSERYWFGE